MEVQRSYIHLEVIPEVKIKQTFILIIYLMMILLTTNI